MSALHFTADGFTLSLRGNILLCHAADAPCIYAGVGDARMAMYRGNFDISDYVVERLPLKHVRIEGALLHFHRDAASPPALTFELETTIGAATLHLRQADPRLNRFWFRIAAARDEAVWGCGEQMSYFNLRGRRFPLWTSEPGVGRDPASPITAQANASHAGGDYYTTNYPQPSFISARCHAVHVETTAYSAFDFRHDDFHELETWAAPQRLEFIAAPDFPGLIARVSTRFGRQPPLPEWLTNGAVIGLKAGNDSFARLEKFLEAGAHVSALWCEDWAGVRATSFGTRLFWNWQWNPARYPDLPRRIADLHARNIRFMGYANPYLCTDGALFAEAEAQDLLARNASGATYRVDFGEFDAGIVDFTNPAASDWFAARILCTNMLDLGLSGWMADFGEYLPIDARLANGIDAKLMHNDWPRLWAQVNANALARAGRSDDALFFMRAGFTGVQRFCPMLWAGDQCVDFSRHDGLPSVICGALSSGLLGNAYHHSDIGGYTSLFGNVRTPELLMRWTEMAAFTPMMRTHEGNRPRDNVQIDDDPAVLAHFARFTRIWCHLAPYLRDLSATATTTGLPLQRPLFLHFPNDPAGYAIQDQYLYGPDLLVAPVQAAGATAWPVYLPQGCDWIHVWSGRSYRGGTRISVAAPLGQPPAFHRAGSPWEKLFATMPDIG